MIPDNAKHEEWLTTISNTRLLFNTMSELELMLDNFSIHSNGIKRSFPSPQKMRSAYRDLKAEVALMTDDILDLDDVMRDYQRAWAFFRDNLYRRTNPEQVALELLAFSYPPFIYDEISPKRLRIYQAAEDLDINIPILILLLLKALPGYDSKVGDVADIDQIFARVMKLLRKFAEADSSISVLPAVTRALEDPHKSRISLLYYVTQVLDAYQSWANNTALYNTSNMVKSAQVPLDIEGYWNECDGKLLSTNFWQIEACQNEGCYFITRWHKDADHKLTGIRFTMFITQASDGQLSYYWLHPQAIEHRIKGIPYSDQDQVWYLSPSLDNHPDKIPLHRAIYSGVWTTDIALTRCVDPDVVAQYDRWLNGACEIVKTFEHLEYKFYLTIYAITPTHIYVESENQGEFYKIPKDACEGFDHTVITDNVGLMFMNKKVYIAFDELLLYIPTSKKSLQKYGIERVNKID